MDVDFSIISPHGVHLASEFRRSDGVHMWVLTKSHTYHDHQKGWMMILYMFVLSIIHHKEHLILPKLPVVDVLCCDVYTVYAHVCSLCVFVNSFTVFYNLI